MSFFPRSYISNDTTSFTPLFRLLDDFESYRGNGQGSGDQQRPSQLRSFTPKFDVKELHEAYELHGELPGIDQKDVEIEFTDEQTLTVKGRTERTYSSGNAPALEGPSSAKAITESGENGHKVHKATVEDADDATDPPTSTAVSSTQPKNVAAKPKEPEVKFWVSERSVGEFSRSFNFPVRVDRDAVKASMKNGILSIVVPKAKKRESKKISIS